MGVRLQDELKAAQAVTYGPKKISLPTDKTWKSLASFTISFKALMTCWESLFNWYVFHEQVYCNKLYHNFVTWWLVSSEIMNLYGLIILFPSIMSHHVANLWQSCEKIRGIKLTCLSLVKIHFCPYFIIFFKGKWTWNKKLIKDNFRYSEK